MDISSPTGGVIIPNSPTLNPTDYFAFEFDAFMIKDKAIIFVDNSQAGVTNSYYMSWDGQTIGFYSTIGGLARNIFITNSNLIKYNDWNSLAVTYNGSAIMIFANGSLLTALACTGSLGTNSGTLRIGQYFAGSLLQTGLMANQRFYNTPNYTAKSHRMRVFQGKEDPEISGTCRLALRMVGSGTSVPDDSGYGNNGTFARGIWSTKVPSKARTTAATRTPIARAIPIKDFRTAISFNGTTSFGATPTINFGGTNRFTLRGYISVTAFGTAQVLLETSANSNTNNAFAVVVDPADGTNRLSFLVHGNTGAAYSYCISNPLVAGTWYYATFVFDGTLSSDQVKIYINGNRNVASYRLNHQVVDAIANNILFFAARNSSSVFAGYRTRDMKLTINKAFSDTEVMTDFIYRAGVSGGTTILNLPCNETTGNIAADTSGNMYHLTTGGSASFVITGPSYPRRVVEDDEWVLSTLNTTLFVKGDGLTNFQDNSLLSYFPDFSGRNIPVSANGSQRPTFYRSTTSELLNSKPTIKFSGLQLLSTIQTVGGFPFTVFMVAKTRVDLSNQYFMDGSIFNSEVVYRLSGGLRLYSNQNVGPIAMPNATWSIITAQFNTTSSAIGLGATEITGSSGAATSPGITLGNSAGGSAGVGLDGSIAVVIVAFGTYSASVKSAIRAGLASRYNLVL